MARSQSSVRLAGVQPQSETVWRQANKYRVPRLAFVNKMDRVGANFYACVEEMRKKLGANAHPLFLPIGAEENFTGLVDLVQMKAYFFEEDPADPLGLNPKIGEIPAGMLADAKKYREKLIEAVADCDDEIAHKYLEGKDISMNELMIGIRKATVSLKFAGVIPGSAFKKKGVQRLLDCVVNYLPNPLDLPPTKGQTGEGAEAVRIADDRRKTVALAFKLWSDPFVGRLVFARVYQGTLTRAQSLYNPRTRRNERVSRLLLMRAMDKEEIDVAYAGDICAVVGVKDVITGTRCATTRLTSAWNRRPSRTGHLDVDRAQVQGRPGEDGHRAPASVGRGSDVPHFHRHRHRSMIIAGMGELHLEIIRDRMFREFKVEADAGKPQIAYRESITAHADGEGKFIRQSGGRGQYGHACVTIEPNEKGKGVEVINEIVGGVVPKEYIKPITEGILEAANNGVVAGFPVIDFMARIVDGSFHEVDSSELAFKMAGIFAFKHAMAKAKPVLLEPIMKVEVTVPEEYQGDLWATSTAGAATSRAWSSAKAPASSPPLVPLETMFGYATDIRSLSKGRASYSMEPSHFNQVPAQLLTKIVETTNRLRPAPKPRFLHRMKGQRIRIKLQGFDYRVIDQSASEIVETAKRSGARVSGPIPLPTNIEKLSVNRSPHVDKKSMEQFETRTHKRLIDIIEPTAQTVDELKKLNLPSGVDITINV